LAWSVCRAAGRGHRRHREVEASGGVWLAEIDVMSGIEFEKYVAAAMRDLGY
jgi:hypothetical protein